MIIFPKVPDLLRVLHLGFGPDCFIAKPWYRNYTATNLFELTWLCPSRDRIKAEQMQRNLRLQSHQVSSNYVDFLQSLSEQGCDIGELVACITTNTDAHASNIIDGINAGLRYFIVDKPLVTNLRDCMAVRAAVEANNAHLVLTYNHQFNAPVHQMRRLARDYGVRSIRTWFYQSWLNNNLAGLRQFDWRTDGKLCGLLDIGSHVENLASFITGQPITSVHGVRLGCGGGHGKGEIYTSGECTANFAGGFQGVISFDQAREGHQDDIGALLTLENGHSYMWRLELGPENLWGTRASTPDVTNTNRWTRHMRGESFYAKDVNETFSQTPGGHHQGWDAMWRYLFTAAAGSIYRRRGINLGFDAGTTPHVLNLDLPGLDDAEQTARFVEATVTAYEGGQQEADLLKIVP